MANTLVLLPKGTIYLGTAKHYSVVKVLKLATSKIAHLFKRVNKGSKAASIPSAEARGFTQPLVIFWEAIWQEGETDPTPSPSIMARTSSAKESSDSLT